MESANRLGSVLVHVPAGLNLWPLPETESMPDEDPFRANPVKPGPLSFCRLAPLNFLVVAAQCQRTRAGIHWFRECAEANLEQVLWWNAGN